VLQSYGWQSFGEVCSRENTFYWGEILTVPVSEKREFDENGDFLAGEKGRLG